MHLTFVGYPKLICLQPGVAMNKGDMSVNKFVLSVENTFWFKYCC